jgi:hypothetical protein
MHLIFAGSISRLSAFLSQVMAEARLISKAQLGEVQPVTLPCPIDRPL